MSDPKLLTGRDLGKAICAHFDLNSNQVQSDYRINTELDGLASISLTISLSPDDLTGIARAAGADVGETKMAVDANTSEILRRYGLRIQRSEPGPELIRFGQSYGLIKGEALAIEPDPRRDEIVTLLKQLVVHAKTERDERYANVVPVRIVDPGL